MCVSNGLILLLSVLSAETRSPMKYFMGEIYGGVSLRSTTTSGNDVERERIYDMIFRLPWRCEVVKTLSERSMCFMLCSCS